MPETNNGVKSPSCLEANRWPVPVAEDLNSGLSRTNPASDQSVT